MTPAEAFLAAVVENPDDNGPRLMYADWLTERGDMRGEFIRAQCDLARQPSLTLEIRIREILEAHGPAWLAALPDLPGIAWEAEFRNGFVEEVTAQSVEAFLEHAPIVFAAAPVRRLNVRRANAADVAALGGSPHLARLHTLDLHGNSVGVEGAKALAASEPFAPVRELFLYDCQLGDAGVRALLRLRHPERLRELFLSINDLTDAAAEAVADAGLTSLVELDLRDNAIGDAGVRALASSPDLAELVTLWLVNNQIGDVGARALAESPHLGRLCELYLRYNRIGSAGAAALARSSRLPELEVLDLGNNRIADAGAQALARTAGLARISELTLTGNPLHLEEGRDALRERFGVRVRV